MQQPKIDKSTVYHSDDVVFMVAAVVFMESVITWASHNHRKLEKNCPRRGRTDHISMTLDVKSPANYGHS